MIQGSRVILDSRFIEQFLLYDQVSANDALVLMLARIRELNAWICSSEIGEILNAVDAAPQARRSIAIARLRCIMQFSHIAFMGEADLDKVLTFKEHDLRLSCLKSVAMKHGALGIVTREGRQQDTQQENSPAGLMAHVLSAAGLLIKMEQEHGATYALVKLPADS